jgi:hypothetical protein
LLEGVIVVIADPLVTVPVYPLDAGYLIPGWFEAVFGDNILDLLEAKNSVRTYVSRTKDRATHSKMPAAFEQGPGLAPPLNWQIPFGVLQEESFSVKLRPY